MAKYVISDIHGRMDKFHEMLKKIDFKTDDELFIIGDVIDRGPDGIPLLQEIMNSPNMHLIMGNHEYMFTRYYMKGSTEEDREVWNINHNEDTKAAFRDLSHREKMDIFDYVASLPTHMVVDTKERSYYLVHGCPGECRHDRVWSRPGTDFKNPQPEYRLIVGHTPVWFFGDEGEKPAQYILDMMTTGGQCSIYKNPEFIDLDCGCGHDFSCSALSCMRLGDEKEFYV